MEAAGEFERVWQRLHKVIVEEVRMQILKDLGRGFKEVKGGFKNVHHVLKGHIFSVEVGA